MARLALLWLQVTLGSVTAAVGLVVLAPVLELLEPLEPAGAATGPGVVPVPVSELAGEWAAGIT
jgi:hypothetical protein